MARQRSNPGQAGLPVGIEARHSRECAGDPCTCTPSYRAWVFDRRTKTRIRASFSGKGALAAAKSWRVDAQAQLNRGTLVAPTKITFREAAEQFVAGIKATSPTVLTRGGDSFKPSVIRGYESDLEKYLLPTLGFEKLSEIRRGDLQRLVDEWVGQGHSGSKVRNIIVALRSIYRWAADLELVASNPTTGLRLPNGMKHRDRAASREELAELLSILPKDIRPIYATAAYAGLRRGELRALRWGDIDLEARRINVDKSWDVYAGDTAPKSKAGIRLAPMPKALRQLLSEHKVRTAADRKGDGDFVFSQTKGLPFTDTNVRKRALLAWRNENDRRTEKAEEQGTKPELLDPIGLHELRHTAISLWFASGVRREVCEDWAGHSSGHVTDIYRHLRPEVFDAELALVDEYVATGRARIAAAS